MQPQQPDPTKLAAEPRDLKYRRQFFPDADEVIFHTQTKGYVPLPILVRKLLRHLTAPEIRLLVYLYTRASQYRICYPTIDEIADELGINRKNVTPHIDALAEKQLIRTRTSGARKFFLLLDPRIAIQHLVNMGRIAGDELFALNMLCTELKQPSFETTAQSE